MLGASNYGALDMVSPFIRVIVDRLCGLDCGLITKTFTLYAELLRFVYWRRMRPGWTESDLQTLSKNMDDVKSEACRVFASDQPIGMGTMKFHFLEHVTENLWYVVSRKHRVFAPRNV